MIPSEIPSNAPVPTPQSDGWGTFFSKWIGRIWSVFSYPLVFLINRVSQVAAFVFHSTPAPEKPEADLTPNANPLKSEEKNPVDENEEVEINISQLFDSTEFNPPAAAKAPSLDDKKVKKLEPSTPILFPTSPASAAQSPSLTLKEKHELRKEKRKQQLQEKRNQPSKTIQKKLSSPRLKRISNPQIKNISSPIKNNRKASKTEILDLGVGAGGDCQPLCLLKGLELQYPNLYKHEVEGKLVPYTVQDIRKIGADLAIEHVENNWDMDYGEEIHGYLDADRVEYNEPILRTLNDSLEKELAALKEQLGASKISEGEFTAQAQIINDKYKKLEKTETIDDNLVYLECLEKKGYYCSSLHLFAFSFFFEIPVHVHHFDGTKNHDVEIFNPKNSKKAPIKLQRSGLHYKLIVTKK